MTGTKRTETDYRIDETTPHVFSVFVRGNPKPLAEFTDELDAKLWALAREASKGTIGALRKAMIDILTETAERGRMEVKAFRAE